MYGLVEKLTFLRPIPPSKIVDKKSGHLVELTHHIVLFIYLTTLVQKCTCFGRLSFSNPILEENILSFF